MGRSGFAFLSIFVIVFLACAVRAAVPVSPPESRFVWEPGENLTFTWTNENFDGFYYDAQSRTGKESLTIMLDNIKDRSIPKDGFVYSTTVETATARYSPFGEYSVIGLLGEKYLAGYPEGKSNITSKNGINPGRLHIILIDGDTSYSLAKGSNLSLSEGYVLEIIDVNVTGAQVKLSLKKDGIRVDTGTMTVDAGKNYIYETQGWPIIAVHIDSVFEGKEKALVTINGIFQVSQYETLVRKGDNPTGVMWVTNISDNSITMKNAAGTVELKPGQIIDIGEINIGELKLKVADSNFLRVHLYKYWLNEESEHRGAAGSNKITAWDGLNYAGFLYDADSGNYSESLVIINLTGRRIPEGGLTYTSYRLRKVPYAITKIKGIKSTGTDGSYVTFSLGGDKYAVKGNGLARMLIAHGDSISELKELKIGFWGSNGETWELGEGYALTFKSLDIRSNPRKARLVLRRNGVELDDVWLSGDNAYRYFQPEEPGTPKLITYLDAVYAGATDSMIILRCTWFVSDNVTQIKEGDRLGIFNVMVVEPDRMVLKNIVPIDLKAGSSINLLGNLSFFVENSDELRFYPTNMAGTQVMSEEVPVNEVPDIPDSTIPAGTPPVADRTESVPGFEVVIFLAALFAVYRIKSRNRMVDRKIGTSLITLLAILLLACAAQAAEPVSPPESRFVWEPGENLTFTWTNENFDGFYYEPWNWTGKESLTITLDNIEDRSVPKEGLVYSTTVETATARYRPFGEYAVLRFMGGKYLAGYTEGKSNISAKSGIDPGRLHYLLIDDDASYSLAVGSNLTLRDGYVLQIIDVNVTGACVILSLKKDEIKVDTGTRKVEAGKNYIYETPDGMLIAVHIDSVFEGKEKASVAINGIFQVMQYETLVRKGDNLFGVMWVTNISDDTITMKNAAGIVELKPGQSINIGNIKLKVADSNTLRVYLDRYWYSEKIVHIGAAGSNNFMAWDGLNYAGFWYDADSGNYSGSLEITNITGRRIPEGGLTYIINMDRLTYTNYMASVQYPVTRINDKKPPGTNWSYVTFNLGSNMYIVNSKIAGILTAHGVTYYYDKKLLVVRPPGIEEDDELANGLDYWYWKPGWDTWELGEGYALAVKSVELKSDPRTARLVLRKNGVELEDVYVSSGNVYRYFSPEETGKLKLITYIDSIFTNSVDSIQLRYTWFVSDNVTQIKDGDRLGVFNVTVVEPDRIVLKNREPIELKAGRIINLYGNLSFFVENSDELRFYPTNMAGTQVIPEGVTENAVLETPDITTPAWTSPAAGKNERVPGFELVLAITILLAVYATGRKKRLTGRK